MQEKCPACGAPMEGDVCGYCSYRKERIPEPEVSASAQPQPEGPFVQQVIIQPQPVVQAMPMVSRKSKVAALLLCIFLGYLGAHRFYVGKFGTGVLYLFTGGLFGIGWVIDIVLIAVGAFRDQFGLPLR